jgi:hypothetical protein
MNRRRAVVVMPGVSVEWLVVRTSCAKSPAKIPVIGLLDAGDRPEWWAAFRRQPSV